MKKMVQILTLIVFMASLTGGMVFAQTDLTGTWIGATEVPDIGEDAITLVLVKKENTYTGTITDSAGMAEEAEITDVDFSEGKLTFNFTIYNGSEYMDVACALTVDGNKMTGQWETEDGSSGSIELEKK
ncbi:hypothetical protein ACFLT9_05305 [Acidobacteriota bacterium]